MNFFSLATLPCVFASRPRDAVYNFESCSICFMARNIAIAGRSRAHEVNRLFPHNVARLLNEHRITVGIRPPARHRTPSANTFNPSALPNDTTARVSSRAHSLEATLPTNALSGCWRVSICQEEQLAQRGPMVMLSVSNEK